MGNYTVVEIHGKAKVAEIAAEPLADYKWQSSPNEHQRLVKAWEYIYSHACKGLKSPF